MSEDNLYRVLRAGQELREALAGWQVGDRLRLSDGTSVRFAGKDEKGKLLLEPSIPASITKPRPLRYDPANLTANEDGHIIDQTYTPALRDAPIVERGGPTYRRLREA